VDSDDPNRPSKSQRLSRSKSQRLAPAKSERLSRAAGRYGSGARSTGRQAALPPEPTSLVGCWLGERFEVGSALRSGPLTEVYRGVDLSEAGGIADDRVTIRVVHERHATEPGLCQSVLAMANALCSIEHPAILQARECDLDQGLPYLVLDPEPGKSLADVVREAGGALPIPRAIEIARQVARALDEVHSAGLIHQGLSPACIFVEEGPEGEDVIRVADFSLLSPSQAMELNLAALTLNAARYASPERAAGYPQEERSDLYALGLILYECLSGQLPFQGFFADQVLKARVGQRIPSISERAPEAEVPVALADVVERVLSPGLGERYSSARAFLKALEVGAEAAAAEANLPPQAPLDVVEELALPGLDPALQVALSREEPGLSLTWLVQTPGRRPADLAAFEEALAAAQRVEHPGLAPLASYGARGPRELLVVSPWRGAPSGESAQAQIERGPLEEVAMVRRLRPVLEGLAAAHEAGLSHGMVDPHLVEFGRRSRLHGLGVVPAARGIPSLTTVDVRDLALLMLQLLAGVRLEEGGVEGVRERGLSQARGKVREVLQTATSSAPYPNVGVMLEVLDQDPRLQAKAPLPYVLGGLAVLLVVGALAFFVSPSDLASATPSPSPTPAQSAVRPSPRASSALPPSPTPQPSLVPMPTPSPELLPTPSPSPSPSPSPEPEGPEAPEWFEAMEEAQRPALPLPHDVIFGSEPGTYLLTRDGSVLVWVSACGAFVGKFEVTWAQYRAFAAASGAPLPEEAFAVAKDHPVHNVSWKDARAYSAWAGARLLSGAEWRAAAGGGRWPWGSQSPDATFANLNGEEDGYAHTSPVGSFPRGNSPTGCVDLAGNVAEWIVDRDDKKRGVRGGGWFSHAWDSRVAWRGHAPAGERFDFVGFRIAVSPR
jgi:sulfatase-modifying factor enzyme 1/protein kinase-like protein